MSVTITSGDNFRLASSCTGMAYGSNPPEIGVYFDQKMGLNGWAKTVPEKMDVKAFTRANGWKPIRAYHISGESCTGELGTMDYIDTVGAHPRSYRIIEADLLTSSAANGGMSFVTATKSTPRFLTLKNIAITRLNNKVRDMDVNLAETLATASQTVDLLADTATRLARAYLEVRKLQFRKAARTLGISVPKEVSRRRSVSENWLEYRYGWLPLYYDAYGVMVALHKGCSKPLIRIVNATAKWSNAPRTVVSKLSTRSKADSSSMISIGNCTWDVSTTGQEDFVVRAGAVIQFTNPGLATLESLGLINGYELVWAVLPGSFIADWFVNIGDKIADMTSYIGKRFLKGYVTHYFKSSKTSITTVPVAVPSKYGYTTKMRSATPAMCQVARYWVDREVLTYPPVVELQFRNGLNAKRLTDAAALLHLSMSAKLKDIKWNDKNNAAIARSKRRSKSTGKWHGSLN